MAACRLVRTIAHAAVDLLAHGADRTGQANPLQDHGELGAVGDRQADPGDIYSGKACVEVDGKNVTELEPGQFIGGISYITEETAPANIVSLEPTRYVSWPKSKLQDFMKKNPDLHSALKTTLAIDLTKWLQATWARQTS
jgi:CRP-like cAMP-binding protein